MNKNTLIGAILIGLLFVWSMHNANQQQEAAQAKALQEAAQAQASQDSLAAIKGAPTVSGSPELVAPQNPHISNDALSAALDAASQDPVSASTVASTTDSVEQPAPALTQRLVTIETNRFTMTLDTKGAMIRSIVAKTLPDSTGAFPELIQNAQDGALGIQFDKADFDLALFALPEGTPDHLVVEHNLVLPFTWTDAQGRTVTREYRFTPDGVAVQHVTRVQGFKPNLYYLTWKGGMRETEAFPTGKSFGATSYFFSEVVLNNTYNVERHTITEQTWFNKEQGKAHWVGLRRKYIAGIINFPDISEAAIGASPIKLNDPNDPGTYALTISNHMVSDSIAFEFLVLPLQWSGIKEMGQDFEKIIVSGWEWMAADKWFVWLCGLILHMLNVFYNLIPNYGVAIILLTLVVKLITTPLAVKQLRATRDMMKLKPELDAIRVKYRADMKTQQQEIMALYARHGLSPFSGMAGCLPTLLQMPIFIGLFVVLGRAIELRNAPFALWITDLSKSDVIWSGISIPYIMPSGLTILPFVMVVSTWFQTKQTITDPNQKAMVYMMPAMMFFFSAVMPSGLVLYWIVSNVWGIAQYMIINRHRNQPPAPVLAHTHKHGKGVVNAQVVSSKKNSSAK